jgi:hypothetical protein
MGKVAKGRSRRTPSALPSSNRLFSSFASTYPKGRRGFPPDFGSLKTLTIVASSRVVSEPGPGRSKPREEDGRDLVKLSFVSELEDVKHGRGES